MNLARNALLLMILLTTGCMALVAGGVAAVGTYTYVSGQLSYPKLSLVSKHGGKI